MAIVNVTNLTPQVFGAAGDGINDDTIPIQNSINYAGAQVINFGDSSKIYKISGTITLKNNQKIIANGAIIKQTLDSVAGTPIFDCTDLEGVEISGFDFQTTNNNLYNYPSSLHVAIKCNRAQNLIIKDNKFTGFTYSAVSCVANTTDSVSNFVFRNNIIIGPGTAVLNHIDKRNCTGITIGGDKISILNNTISETAQGLIITERSKDVVISNNIIFDTRVEHGMYVDRGVSDLVISNNTLRNIAGNGIKVQNNDDLPSPGATYISKNVVIAGNLINGTGTEVGTSTGINNTSGDGIQVNNTASTTAENLRTSVNNLIVTGNSISGVNQYGINIRFAKNANISGNSISGNPVRPDIIEKGTLVKNTITKNQVMVYGIYCSNNTDVVFSNNLISECKWSGIWDDNTGSGEITYSNNYISEIGKDTTANVNAGNLTGIFIAHNPNLNVIRGRNIKMNTIIGATVSVNSQANPPITNPLNTVYGLFIEGGDLSKTEIRANSFINVKDYGIRLPGSSTLLNNSYLRYFGENVILAGTANVNKDIVLNLPAEVQRGEQNIYFASQIPTTGNWLQGTIIYSQSPVPSGNIGWVCVVGGNPGTWKTFGSIAS